MTARAEYRGVSRGGHDEIHLIVGARKINKINELTVGRLLPQIYYGGGGVLRPFSALYCISEYNI